MFNVHAIQYGVVVFFTEKVLFVLGAALGLRKKY